MRAMLCLICLLILKPLYAADLIIGASSSSPPFVMRADQSANFFGFDVDLMSEICRRLNNQCNYKMLPFEGLFTALDKKEIDLAIGEITITPERANLYLFSLPYFASKAQYITFNASSIHKADDLIGHTVGIEKGTVFEGFLKSTYREAVTIKPYDDLVDLAQDLSEGKVDAALVDAPNATYWSTNYSTNYRLVGDAIPVGIGYGIMARKDNQALIALINQQIIDIEKDGSYIKIYTRYFGDH